MSAVIDDELSAWIISWLVTHDKTPITSGIIISDAPQPLIQKMENEQQIIQLLYALKNRNMLADWGDNRFLLTNNGLLAFRKYLEPIFMISKDKKGYVTILDKTTGNPKTKKEVKKILEKIKDKLPEEAYEILLDFLKRSGVDGLFFIIRLIAEGHTNGG